MRDVGDGDHEPVHPSLAPPLDPLDVDRVVEVARVLAVDGDERRGAVRSRRPRPILAPDVVGDGPRLGLDRLGEHVGEPLRVGDLQHLDARLAGPADRLDDRAREPRGARIERDLHDVAVLRDRGLRHGDVGVELGVRGDDEALRPRS